MVMAYGRHVHQWGKEESIPCRPGDEQFSALLGITNASFVEFLIRQHGLDLGIKGMTLISIRRGGLDVYWEFE
jgi:hypothetical protein